MNKIFTAKSVEEAKALAAAEFRTDVKNIRFEVLDEGKKGFLGLGKTDAKVRAIYEAPKKQAAPVQPKPVVSEPAAKTETPKTETPVQVKAEEESKAPVVEDLSEKKEKTTSGNSAKYAADDFNVTENAELITDESLIAPKVKIARDYIDSLLTAMDIKAEFTVYQSENGAVINIDSDNNGTIIGRRGETLDAIQYLCSIISNKGDKDYFRITIDCLGYRSKRKETLEQLAAKVAKNVLRTGRSQPLEPMNPYERRVIHSAVAEIEGVSSRSVGEEPYRKIIISSNNPKRRRDNRRPNDRRGSNPKKDFERRNVDLSTSFEKDYKRPKPEDNIEGGLYGKIEL